MSDQPEAPKRNDVHSRPEPWWQREISSLRAVLLQDMRRRFPALRNRHEDLVHESLADLTARIAKGGDAIPASWLATGEPESEDDRVHLIRLGRTILRRRVADMFRSRVRAWAELASVEDADLAASQSVATDQQVHTTELLKATLLAMDKLSDADRDALVLAAERDGERVEGRMPDKDRQRLSRARARLLELLKSNLSAKLLLELHDEP